jgi:hypothetical protein
MSYYCHLIVPTCIGIYIPHRGGSTSACLGGDLLDNNDTREYITLDVRIASPWPWIWRNCSHNSEVLIISDD